MQEKIIKKIEITYREQEEIIKRKSYKRICDVLCYIILKSRGDLAKKKRKISQRQTDHCIVYLFI